MNVLARFVSRRCGSSAPQQASAMSKRRRFYKEVGIVDEKVGENTVYKFTLDGGILKTQTGKPLQIESEPLALAVAEEWSSQEEHIEMGHMRLTGLAFTAQDNPLHNTKESITEKILEYLEGDTVLYWNREQEALERAQQQYWKPIIDHANRNLGTQLRPVENMFAKAVSSEDTSRVSKWLMSHNQWALTGMQYAVETSKSVLLPYNVLTFNTTAAHAIDLTVLEQKVQSRTWGEVEWFHGIEGEELTARLSAACLFVYFNSNKYTTTITNQQ